VDKKHENACDTQPLEMQRTNSHASESQKDMFDEDQENSDSTKKI